MKKIFKMTAVFLGWSSCIAQPGKCPGQTRNDLSSAQQEFEQNKVADTPPAGLAVFQSLDTIYNL